MIHSTLRSAANMNGAGLHTGAASTATIHPAGPGSGLFFETGNGKIIAALAENVVDTSRCTVIGRGTERISTVEHLLSACLGLGVTDARIVVTGPEIPIGDGSAQCWTDLISEAGVEESAVTAEPFRVRGEIVVSGADGSFLAAYPSDRFRLTVGIAFPHPLVGTQVARFTGPDAISYGKDIAAARTFGFIEEVEALLAAGLAKGGSFDNAIVIYPDRYSSPLRFEDELARHKLLDVIGDLALSGCPGLPFADIIAVKPSHRLNVELAGRLRAERERAQSQEG